MYIIVYNTLIYNKINRNKNINFINFKKYNMIINDDKKNKKNDIDFNIIQF